MTAGLAPLYMEQGADFDSILYWKDSTGNPIVITGWSAKMQIRPFATSDALEIELSTDNGRIVIDGANGKLTLHVPGAITSTIPENPDNYVYDILLTSPTGLLDRLLEGALYFSAAVTK